MKKTFHETMDQHRKRVKNEGFKEPLKTIVELAEEYGYSAKQLGTLMGVNGGPKYEMKYSCARTYYKPSLVKAWHEQYIKTKGGK